MLVKAVLVTAVVALLMVVVAVVLLIVVVVVVVVLLIVAEAVTVAAAAVAVDSPFSFARAYGYTIKITPNMYVSMGLPIKLSILYEFFIYHLSSLKKGNIV